MSLRIRQLLDAKTHPTGSKAYGLPNYEDDDRFCTSTDYDEIVDALQAENIPTTHGGSIGESVKFDIGGVCVNLIMIDHREIENIKLVTQIMATACSWYPKAGERKELRVALFEQLRSSLKMWGAVHSWAKKKGNAAS